LSSFAGVPALQAPAFVLEHRQPTSDHAARLICARGSRAERIEQRQQKSGPEPASLVS
jgi:hypothetical protein